MLQSLKKKILVATTDWLDASQDYSEKIEKYPAKKVIWERNTLA